ncbi:MAG: insulinase family protein [Bacilli bacterium]|nr:insulinase family protein [Bacilli bacterium]
MEYKKITRNNINLHLINSDRFKTVNVILFFTKYFNKEDIVFSNALTNILVYSSKKYNTKNKMATKGEDLYGARVSTSFSMNGKCETISFALDFINPKYTDNKYWKESLDFLKEIVFNPNVSNNEFKKEHFDIVKNDGIAGIKSVKSNPNLYASIEYSKVMYKGTESAYSSIPTLEEIEGVTPANLYDFYKTLFDGTYKFDIAVIGEVDESISDLLFEIFGKIKSNTKKMSLTIKHKYSEKVNTKIDSLPFNQSKLYVGYRLLNMNYHEISHVLRVYNTILGTMNDSILFNVVREENSLCYSIGSYVSKYNPSLTIYAGINKNNYDKTIELIKKCVEDMSDINKVKRLFESAKKTINTYINSYYDDVVSQVNTYYYREFEYIEDIEDYRDKINEVTIDEVIELNKKIKLSTIYMLKGDN